MNSQIPRKHHFIPVFYLKGWTGDDGKIIAYKNYGQFGIKPRRMYPNSVGYATDTYIAGGVNFEASYFKGLDDRAAKVFNVLRSVEKPHLSGEQGSTLIEFIVKQMVRHPLSLENAYNRILLNIKEGVPELDNWVSSPEVQLLLEKEGGEIPQSYRDFSRIFLTNEDHREVNLQSVVDFGLDEKVRSIFSCGSFVKMNFQGAEFKILTSDMPVVISPGSWVAIPLSPYSVLVNCFNKQSFLKIIKIPRKAFVREFNLQIVGNAVQYVFSIDSSQDRFILNNMSRFINI